MRLLIRSRHTEEFLLSLKLIFVPLSEFMRLKKEHFHKNQKSVRVNRRSGLNSQNPFLNTRQEESWSFFLPGTVNAQNKTVTAVFTPQRLPSVFSELSLHVKRRPCRSGPIGPDPSRAETLTACFYTLRISRDTHTGVKTCKRNWNVNSNTSDAPMLMLPHFLTFTCSEAAEGNVRKRGTETEIGFLWESCCA